MNTSAKEMLMGKNEKTTSCNVTRESQDVEVQKLPDQATIGLQKLEGGGPCEYREAAIRIFSICCGFLAVFWR